MQAVLWTLVPALFYCGAARRRCRWCSRSGTNSSSAPISGRRSPSGSRRSPSSRWRHLFGVYLLSQICVVVTFWAVFALGRAIVGAQHAAMAVLLMVGIVAFSVPTPDFGPVDPRDAAVGADPAALLAGGRRGTARIYWVALGVEIGLLLLTTYAGADPGRAAGVVHARQPGARAPTFAYRRSLDRRLVVAIVVLRRICLARESDASLLSNLAVGPSRHRSPTISRQAAADWCSSSPSMPGWRSCSRSLVAWRWGRHEPGARVIVRLPVGRVRAPVRLLLRARCRPWRRPSCDRCSDGRCRSAASRRWWCCRGSRS